MRVYFVRHIQLTLILAKVQGSFKDVRAPPLTIDSLQSLISLPLIRPDLFKKGILKKNFIPGVLLFGPPGTGKVWGCTLDFIIIFIYFILDHVGKSSSKR